MRTRRTRSRRKDATEKQKPFFDKQNTGPLFFGANQVQRKLSVSKPGDASEKEADSAAQKITQVQKAEKKEEEPVQKAEKKEEETPVQKEEKKEEKPVQKEEKKEEEKPVQKAEKKEEEKPVQKEEKKEEAPVQARQDPRVQRAAMAIEQGEPDASNPSFEERLMKRKGIGFELPDDLRRDMEGKFHTSFKDVRIHTDKEAAEMCDTVHALAFAHGYDIYFNSGMYNPEAESGRELLAHELAHVVQQNG
jgi:hypothetical protein